MAVLLALVSALHSDADSQPDPVHTLTLKSEASSALNPTVIQRLV